MKLPLPVSLLGAAALEQGIDTLLQLDPITRQRLALIDGRVIRVEVSSPPLDLVAVVAEGRVSVPSEFDDEVDLTIRGSLGALRSLAGSSDAIHTGDVTITGDVGVAGRLKEILAGIDPDWQELVSPVIGDTATHKLERVGREFNQWFSRAQQSFGENTHDYLVDEVSMLASARQVAEYSDGVDSLREDMDRVAARLARIERRMSDASASQGASTSGTRSDNTVGSDTKGNS